LKQDPQPRIFGKGGSIIDSFGVGRFLTRIEVEKIYSKAYSCIPENAKNKFLPFRTIENFINSLIFNPKIIFNSYASLVDMNIGNEFAYLVFYFGSYYEQFPDTVYEIQYNQLMNGNSKNYFISPYGWHFALFKINNHGNIELIRYAGIN
jgi:hypothetical protein